MICDRKCNDSFMFLFFTKIKTSSSRTDVIFLKYVCTYLRYVISMFVDYNIFNFVSCYLINFKYMEYSVRNVRANANFSGIVAKEFRPNACESVNFATVLTSVLPRFRERNFARPSLHLGYPLSFASVVLRRFSFSLPECRNVSVCSDSRHTVQYLILRRGVYTHR